MSIKPAWLLHPVKGVLLDISGVLTECTDDGPKLIEGSLDAVKRLKDGGIPFRLCTNESQLSQRNIWQRLYNLGFPVLESEVFSPIPAAKALLKERNLRPYCILHTDAEHEFDEFDQSNPNCLVLGDAAEGFNYENMNKAFQVLMKAEDPVLIAMGYGKFYNQNGELVLDVGPFSKLLEFACSIEPIVTGKPAPDFFMAALNDMNVTPEEALMIGDDIVSDVGGAQKCGMRGIQVRTGKYRPSFEPHLTVTPDAYVDNLAQAVDLLLQNRNTDS